MPVARVLRYLLSAAVALIVVWAFFDVGRRAIIAHRASADRPIKLTVLHWGDQGEDKVVQQLILQFMAEHPQVDIERINCPVDKFDSKLKTMLSAGMPPDVFYLRPDSMAELAEMKLIAPVQQRFAAEPAALQDDFFPLLLDVFRYETATKRSGAGTLYGLPKDFETAGFYVNLDLFKAAGVVVPYGGWTWDEFEADMAKITALRGTPGYEGRAIYGGVFELWSDTIRNIIWTYGGDFFGPDGFRDVTLDSPESQAALQMIYRTRLINHTVYNPTGVAKDPVQEFFNGNIGCDGPVGRWKCPYFKTITNFKWDVVPVPHGTTQASQIYTTAWAMSASTAHPDESYELIKFLTGREGQIMESRLGLAIPSLKSIAYSSDFLSPPGLPPMNAKLFLDAISYARLQQNPSQPEWPRIIEDNIPKSIQLGQETPLQSAQRIKKLWLAELDSPLRRQEWQAMNWRLILAVIIGLGIAAAGWLWRRARAERLGLLDRSTERAGWIFISPWVIGFVVLTLGPMVISLLLSFTQWTGMTPLATAKWVGAANYRQMLWNDPKFFQSIKVTLYFVVLAVPIGQIASLGVALLTNVRVRGIAWFRTIYFLPTVVSGVALAILWLQIFNNDYGLLNRTLRPIATLFGTTPPDWFGGDAHRWAVPAFVIMSLWGVGGGMVIYLAGLKSISASLYDAAMIDGAGPLRRLWNVTLPMLSPLIFYNLVMAIIASFQIFTQAYVMEVKGSDNTTLFYVLNLYREAFEFHKMGYASALAWVLFLIVLGLTLLLFRGSSSIVYYEGLKT